MNKDTPAKRDLLSKRLDLLFLMADEPFTSDAISHKRFQEIATQEVDGKLTPEEANAQLCTEVTRTQEIRHRLIAQLKTIASKLHDLGYDPAFVFEYASRLDCKGWESAGEHWHSVRAQLERIQLELCYVGSGAEYEALVAQQVDTLDSLITQEERLGPMPLERAIIMFMLAPVAPIGDAAADNRARKSLVQSWETMAIRASKGGILHLVDGHVGAREFVRWLATHAGEHSIVLQGSGIPKWYCDALKRFAGAPRAVTPQDNAAQEPATATPAKAEKTKVVAVPSGTTWKQIRIKLLTSDDGTRRADAITVFLDGKLLDRYSCCQLGMAAKNTMQPNREWNLLVEMARNNGRTPRKPFFRKGTPLAGIHGENKSRQALNRTLRLVFGIESDAIVKDKDGEWRAAFSLEPESTM